jgi:polyisoprenyl-teichoic acid--peptidoglycan teichoic acid transferase
MASEPGKRPLPLQILTGMFIFLGILTLVVLGVFALPPAAALGPAGPLAREATPAAALPPLLPTPSPSPPPSQPETLPPPPQPGPELLPTASPTPFPTPHLPTPDPWQGDRRINILLLGLDYADWDSADRTGPPRSDTLILVSVDPRSKSVAVISIPRDLWVDIPGMIRPNRINAAHRFGELYNLPGGGPALAARTVEQVLGVKIEYYVRLDFRAFERIVDELDGVFVEIPEEITVDPIGPNNTVVLQPGRQLLDGPTALAYARNRYTAGSDFDRSRRQQQVMFAIRDRLLQLNRLPRTILKAPALYNELEDGIVTNLTLEQAIQLAWLIPQVKKANIHTAVIGPNQIEVGMTEDGQSIYLPRTDRIRWLVEQVFAGKQP